MDDQDIGISYLKTIPGILKLCQEVVNFIGLMCIATTFNFPRGEAFLACSIIALIITAAIVVLHVTGLTRKLDIPWYKIEFGYSIFIAIFYLVTASLCVSIPFPSIFRAYVAAGVFGFIAIVLYIVDAKYQYQAMMS